MNLINNKIISLMNKRGFKFEKTIDTDTNISYMFVNENDLDKYYENIIIVEVFENKTYHFYYRQSGMIGFMDSGELGQLENDTQFNFNYKKFEKQVNCLRGLL